MWPSPSASSSFPQEQEEEEEKKKKKKKEGVWGLKLSCLSNWINNRRKRSGEVTTKDEGFALPPVVNFDRHIPLSILLFLLFLPSFVF